jgi:outer membrane protein
MKNGILVVAALITALSIPARGSDAADGSPHPLSLEECIDVALENSRQRSVSQLAVEIAEAQYRQALSARWPQAVLTSALVRRDDDPVFIFPEETSTYSIGLGGQALETTVTIPDKHVVLMDRTHFTATVDVIYPLYTGGLRGAVARQGRAGVTAATQAARRTDLQVVYDVRRMYWGAVLAGALVDVGQEALARLEVTLELTENLYKKGSGRVKKTDWLKHKVVVESLRSLVFRLESSQQLARAALANTMGLPWDREVEPAVEEIPYEPYAEDLESLVAEGYRFNPDWGRLQAGLRAAAAEIDRAGSGRLPKVALIGQLQALANAHDKGIVGPDEKRSWLAGIGVELPLFDGFLTRNRIREARARLERLEHQQVLLREGLALQVKAIFIELARAQNQEGAAGAALEAASDNRRLNVRAYQDDLVELQDVIEAQLMESFMSTQYQLVRYGHALARAQLEFVIGREVAQLMQEGS